MRHFFGVVDVTKSSSRGFYFLNVTQFLGAANDNILKQVLIFGLAAGGIWGNQLGEGGQGWASLCLAIPFVLLSGFAGQFSDKFSKRQVSILSKWSEILIAFVAMLGLWIGNVWLVLAALVIIAIQSTFFSPAKFGILPEIMPKEKLSRANGTINMFTYVAIILGSAVGGPLYDAYAPQDPETAMRWLPGIVILIIGVLGTLASYGIPKLPAQNPNLKISYRLFDSYFSTWKELSGTTLKSVILVWAYFYLVVAGIAILIIADYKELLGITATRTALLMALLGISTGIGDYVAGWISGHRIRPALIPLGAIGTSIPFLALGLIPNSFVAVTALLAAGGFMAGFVMVPLQTMVQQLAGDEKRGQVLGLWNCLSFVGIILGNFLFIGLKQLNVPSNRVFIVCAILTLLLLIAYQFKLKKQFNEAVNEDGSQHAG
jgi:acyl-[acyl-carrier-protein]-phospholipid O-acyltransferase/long-chain-fatty-acid--[acyl-carrier-protein] ligase